MTWVLSIAKTVKSFALPVPLKVAAIIAVGIALCLTQFAAAPGAFHELDELYIRAKGGCQYYGHWFDRASPDWSAEKPEVVHFGKANDCVPERGELLFLPERIPLPPDAEPTWAEPDLNWVMKQLAVLFPLLWITMMFVAVPYWTVERCHAALTKKGTGG